MEAMTPTSQSNICFFIFPKMRSVAYIDGCLFCCFTAFIPNQRSISPITKSNWEGIGVIPDLPVDANKALLVARIEILQNQLQKTVEPRQRSEIVESILELKVQLKKM